jgi:hypothetical protein
MHNAGKVVVLGNVKVRCETKQPRVATTHIHKAAQRLDASRLHSGKVFRRRVVARAAIGRRVDWRAANRRGHRTGGAVEHSVFGIRQPAHDDEHLAPGQGRGAPRQGRGACRSISSMFGGGGGGGTASESASTTLAPACNGAPPPSGRLAPPGSRDTAPPACADGITCKTGWSLAGSSRRGRRRSPWSSSPRGSWYRCPAMRRRPVKSHLY